MVILAILFFLLSVALMAWLALLLLGHRSDLDFIISTGTAPEGGSYHVWKNRAGEIAWYRQDGPGEPIYTNARRRIGGGHHGH